MSIIWWIVLLGIALDAIVLTALSVISNWPRKRRR